MVATIRRDSTENTTAQRRKPKAISSICSKKEGEYGFRAFTIDHLTICILKALRTEPTRLERTQDEPSRRFLNLSITKKARRYEPTANEQVSMICGICSWPLSANLCQWKPKNVPARTIPTKVKVLLRLVCNKNTGSSPESHSEIHGSNFSTGRFLLSHILICMLFPIHLSLSGSFRTA